MSRIENGHVVSLYFTLSLLDGVRVDGTQAGEPWQVVVGQGDLPPGLDRCLLGLAPGEQGRFVVQAADAYGERDENAREILPRAQFPGDVTLSPGMAFGFTLPDGEEVMGQVIAVGASGIEMDFNHPLAGYDLVFEVDIVSVQEGCAL
ncbi:MAG: peptidylprolyl isomerase [Gammaproteobacteria bacterium]|nr:peptidylprolyl isomerase [Gammaproteobacteria bacterium]